MSAEEEPSYLGLPIRIVADRLSDFVDQHIFLDLPIDESRTYRVIVPKQAMIDAGISLEADDQDIDCEEVERILKDSINPSLN